MSEPQAPQDPRQRIAELEQELAQLRSQVGAEPRESAALSPALAGSPAPAEGLEPLALLPSRNRAIGLAVAIGLVALAAIISIILALSSAIQPLSRTAASALAPWDPQDQPAQPANGTLAAPPAAVPPAAEGESTLRAPGL